MKKLITFSLFLLFIFFTTTSSSQNIVINEILTSNTISNTDEDGTHQDWIELYNNGTTSINLSGYGLSDDVTLLNKWVFPNVSLLPNQYLLIWASDKNRTVPGSPLHTNFKISSSGEIISLTNASGVLVDRVPATQIPTDVSYGRLPNGTGGFVFFENSTPNAQNSTVGYAEASNPPTFSQKGGFLTSNFNLLLSTSTSGATILYTLDGSQPDANNLGGTTYNYKNQYPESPGQTSGPLLQKAFQTLQYTAPIAVVDRSTLPNKIASISSTYDYNPTYLPANPIFKGTVVRAKVIKPGALSSKVVTQSYFISQQGASKFSLPVISLSTNENNLFDYNNGMYVAGIDFDNWRTAHPSQVINFDENANYTRIGNATERPANINYFVNGTEVLNQDIGIRIHGGTTRAFRSKAFTVYARSEYGANSLDYKFFSDVQDASFKRLVLRNSGGDFVNTMFRDALNQELIKSLHVETEAYQPSIVFINGEYWGILNIREKYDTKYFNRVYNFGDTELDFLENENSVLEGDNADYLNMISYIRNNSLASDANYTYIKTRLDPESFSDYFISNIFFQNADWPGTNIQFWRKKTSGYLPSAPYGHDGRWRWAIHDMDDTFSFGTDNFSYNTLAAATATNGPSYPNPEWSTLLLRKLLENPTFKIDFINRFADLMNTSFLSSRIISTMNTMKGVIAPEIEQHISRWKAIVDLAEWNYYLNYQQNFATARPAIQRDHIRGKFNISSNIDATLNVSNSMQGFIKMNTIDIIKGTPGITADPYPWTGIYFMDIPVKLKAIANPGFAFSHWSGASTSTSAEITITLSASFSVTAHFVPDEVTETYSTIYFWLMDDTIINDMPLEKLSPTYKLGTAAILNYESSLTGYPFTSTSPNWRKASMERRNNPTPINYRPDANENKPYDLNTMKGLQIKQPFQNSGKENTILFDFSTEGYKKIKFSFAAIDELSGINNINVDYAVNAGNPVWITTSLANTSLPLTSTYGLFNLDFSTLTAVDDTASFKIRLRFSGPDMTLDAGNRITFNNFALEGVQLSLIENGPEDVSFTLYPNPFTDVVNVIGVNGPINYKLFTIDGKMIKEELLQESKINFGDLSTGIYLLKLFSNEKSETKKIIKK